MEFVPVHPVSPPAPYLGGKRILARRLANLIDRHPHRTYVDVFNGMGGVFLRRTQRPAAEVINDLSGDVANLFRLLQRHYAALIDLLRWQLTSREEFDRLRRLDPATLTDLERAARFLYLQRLAFGGRVSGRTFGVDRRTPGRFDVTKLERRLAELHGRLAGVTVERLPYAEALRRYDAPATLFYLDPPYSGCEEDYGAGMFEAADFERLSETLEGINGRFLLSIDAAPAIRRLFGGFAITEVATTYTINSVHGSGGKRVRELLVTNCPTIAAQAGG